MGLQAPRSRKTRAAASRWRSPSARRRVQQAPLHMLPSSFMDDDFKKAVILPVVVAIPFYVPAYFPPERLGDKLPPHEHTELSSSITFTQANIVAEYGSTPIARQVPFSQLDWPVPRGAAPSISLRTWIHPLNLNLLG
jgi:hypothetical protein